MRRSELVKLKPDNIKLELNQIHILGKGKKNRIVGIHADLVEELTARVKKGQIVPKLYPDSITSAFRKIIKAAGLSKDLTLHSLRHSLHHLPARRRDADRSSQGQGRAQLFGDDESLHSCDTVRVHFGE